MKTILRLTMALCLVSSCVFSQTLGEIKNVYITITEQSHNTIFVRELEDEAYLSLKNNLQKITVLDGDSYKNSMLSGSTNTAILNITYSRTEPFEDKLGIIGYTVELSLVTNRIAPFWTYYTNGYVGISTTPKVEEQVKKYIHKLIKDFSIEWYKGNDRMNFIQEH